MRVGIKVTDPQFKIKKYIIEELRSQILKKIPPIFPRVKKRIGEVLANKIRSSEEYGSIKSGKLLGQLGLSDPNDIDDIINIWSSNVSVEFVKNTKLGYIKIGMIKSDYSDVLSSPSSFYTYVTPSSAGSINWLKWLLIEGTNTIILNYEFRPDLGDGGRTGRGIMVERIGASWSIPPEFAGTATNNFATRSLENIDLDIEKILKEEIMRI